MNTEHEQTDDGMILDEFRKCVENRLKLEMFDKYGILKENIAASDFYGWFTGPDVEEVVDQEFGRLSNITAMNMIYAQTEIINLKDYLLKSKLYEEEIKFYNLPPLGKKSSYYVKAFRGLINKFKLIKVNDDTYTVLTYNNEIYDKLIDYNYSMCVSVNNNNDMYFKYYNTKFNKFLIESEKLYITNTIFILPLTHKILRGKNKGIHYYYLIIDNELETITQHEVPNLRFINDNSTIYKFLSKIYSKMRLNVFIEELTQTAPKIGVNNENIIKKVFNNRTSLFYNDNKLLK